MHHDLRFRFEYSDGKPTVFGKWNDTNKHAKKQAWSINRHGLCRAIIEARNVATGEIKAVVDCPGSDYRFMQWRAVRSINLKSLSDTTLTRNIGLVMWTTNKKILVYAWGKIELQDLSEEDQKFNFAAYGR